MNILEIIKKAPEDHVYYSLLIGECHVDIIKCKDYPIIATRMNNEMSVCLSENGKYIIDSEIPDGECVLFPSRDNRDWEAFERELNGVKDNDSHFNPPAYGTDSYKDGVFSGYSKMGDMIEINLDHKYYEKLPYIYFQIDGEKHRVSTEEIKRLVIGNADNKTEHVSGQSFDGTAEIVSIPDRPMMAAVICAGLLARGCKDKGATLINKAVNYADMILDYTKEGSNDKC